MPAADLISDYRILRDTNPERLTKSVEILIQKGWQPFHAPFGLTGEPPPIVQAVVRYGESGAFVRDLRLEGVRLIQDRLLSVMNGGEIDIATMLKTVLQIETELEEKWKRLNEKEVKEEKI